MTEWSPTGDELLLARLGEALLPSFDGPSADAVNAFRQTVAAHRAGPGRRKQSIWSKGRVALAAILGTTTLGAGVAFAAGAQLPAPLRAVAHGLGLPVDSPAVSAARNADDALSQQLRAAAHGEGSTVAIAADASKLSKRLAALNPSERKQLGTTPNSLLAEAKQVVPPVTTPRAGGSTTTAPPSSPSTGGPASTLPHLTVPTLPPVTVPALTLPTVPTATFTLPSPPPATSGTLPGLLDK